MRCIKDRFPSASIIELDDSGLNSDAVLFAGRRFTACLAALPGGCWPAAGLVRFSTRKLPAHAAVHAARLCPRLRSVSFHCSDREDGAALAGAFEGLAAVAGTLQVLEFSVMPDTCGDDGARRAVAALTRLSGLRRLCMYWDFAYPHAAADVLSVLLPE